MPKKERSEQVYEFIWKYVTEREALPTRYQIAEALAVPEEDVGCSIYVLRQQGRIWATTLLPTAYQEWWGENVRAGQRWNLPTAFFRRKIAG